jgi:hypothetical protein
MHTRTVVELIPRRIDKTGQSVELLSVLDPKKKLKEYFFEPKDYKVVALKIVDSPPATSTPP